MDEPFDLSVTYKGEELLFPTRLLQLGYIHKFEVEVHGNLVYFEWDEERNIRAFVDPILVNNNMLKQNLIQAIAEAIEALIK
jgi:hypothetical protein